MRALTPRRWLAVGLLAAALIAAVGVGARRHRVSLPTDPRRYVPAGARVVLSVDMARARAGGQLDRWLGASGAAGCEQQLFRSVARVVVVAPRVPIDSFALAAQGGFTPEAFLACATARGGGVFTTARESRDGIEVVRVVPRDASRPAGAEVVLLPGSLVLAGDPTLVRAMLDAAWPGRSARADALSLERARLGEARSAVASVVLEPDDTADVPWLRGARGAVAALDLEGGLSSDVAIVFGDDPSAAAAAEGLRDTQRSALAHTEDSPVRSLIASARIAARGREVRVSAGLNADATDALARLAAGMFDRLSRAVGETR